MNKFKVFDNKVVLITGGTGSFGQAFSRKVLENSNPEKLVIFSRDEMKQWQMASDFEKYGHNIRFFIGDVRDKERLQRALDGVHYVVHAAATKIVPTAEYNPFECIKTNVIGAMNLIDACIDKGVERCVALSTDKASSPINLYGAAKLASDKLFVAGNAYSGEYGTTFSVVRYGNVMGSRGSVIPLFLKLKDTGELPVTHKDMTRFMITLDEGIDLVMTAFEKMYGGEIYVKKIPSMRVVDIAAAIAPGATLKDIGIRPGEKMHEQMIGTEDSHFTLEFDDYYKILPSINNWQNCPKRRKGGKPVEIGFEYSSGNNTDWMSIEHLSKWIEENKDSFLKI